jgi:Leucine-rich repeat (LRR) protein
VDLAPIEARVEGERHLTATGSDRKADSDLALKPDLTVLQMANSPDVSDRTLESLRGLKVLKELDLNDTQVTDAGLTVLRDLPALESLRLARTKVTDKGFREALFDKDSLMQLDLQGTRVSRETMRAWRDAKPGRKVLPPPG